MLEEKNCPKEDRFLPIIALGNQSILPSKESVNILIEGNKNIDQTFINQFFNWEQSENEIIAYCGYGYCDTGIPKTYDCLFDTDNLDHPISIQATIKYVIWNGLLPIKTIDHGHKTIGIIAFKNHIPSILKKLPDWNDLQLGNYQYDKFGLCNKSDFKFIAEKRKSTISNF